MHRCNTKPPFAASLAEARNNPAGRTTRAEEGFRCVTTRRQAQPFSPTPNRPRRRAGLGRHFAAAGCAPPPHVSHAPRTSPAGRVAAAWRANDVPSAGTRDLGSTAGSTAGHDTAAHTPCEGRSAIPAAGPWPGTHLRLGWFRWYLARVPWEVATPGGRPGRMRLILLGHFTPAISSFSDRRPPATDFLPPRSLYAATRRKPRKADAMLSTATTDVKPREGNLEEHVPNAFCPGRRRKKTVPRKKIR